jgi:hypothetical protein
MASVLASGTRVRHDQLVKSLKYVPLFLILTIALCAAAEEAASRTVSGSAARPLPGVSELIRNLLRGQQELETVRKNYIFTMEEDEQEPTGRGGMRTVHRNTYEVHYSGPWVVEVLTARDGRQLSPAEISQENDKEMRRARLGLAKLESDPEAEGSGGLRLSDFLAADQFTNLRRERYRGREVLVLDFVPNPKFRPRRTAEKVLTSLSGKVWIDEQDMRPIRLEARLTDTVRFGGILASIKKGAAVVFEQQKVNNEIWLPSYTELHFDSRKFFSGTHVNLIHRFSNYRKFQVDTAIKPF